MTMCICVYRPICLCVHPCVSVHGCVHGCVYCLCMSVCAVQCHRRHVERRPFMEKLDCAMLILDELVDEG